MTSLPEFQPRPREVVISLLQEIFSHDGDRRHTHFHRIEVYPDGHFRAIFRPSYFILPEGQHEPSKSQWNTLKKKLKRHAPRLFVFKEHGEVPCDGAAGDRCYYVDIGFFAH